MTVFRPSVVGALTGAMAGAVGRLVIAALHVYEIGQTTIPGMLAVAVLGLTIGGLAGLTGRPILGAIVGATLSAIAYIATYPITMLFVALGALRSPSLAEVLAVGAMAGALGGIAARLAWRTRERPLGR